MVGRDGGRKPCRVSFLASSWTAVALRDLYRRSVYLLCPCGLAMAVVSTFVPRGGGVVGISEWETFWCPQLLHLFFFDFFGIKRLQSQPSISFREPIQTVGIGRAMVTE